LLQISCVKSTGVKNKWLLMAPQLDPKGRSHSKERKLATKPSSFYRVVVADPVGEEWDSLKHFLRREWIWVLMLLAGVVGLVFWLRPLPPSHVRLAVGAEHSSMAQLAKRFIEPFAQAGVELQLVFGSIEAQQPASQAQSQLDVQAALVIGGAFKPNELLNLVSLGSFEYAPLWFFYRGQRQLHGDPFTEFAHKSVAIGERDSATYALVEQLAALHDISISDQATFQALSPSEGVEKLLRNEIDAVAIVDGYESQDIQRLLAIEDIHLFDFSLAPAYEKHLPFMEVVTVPRAALNIPRLEPPIDSSLIASTVSLLVDKDLHPTLQQLFLTTTDQFSDETDPFFARPDFFPAYIDQRVPLSPIARRYFEEGKLPLSDRLPYWLASLIDRIWLLIVGLVAVIYPILKLLPHYRLIRSRTHILDAYRYIRFVDASLKHERDPDVLLQYVDDLDWLEEHLRTCWMSSDLYRDYYSLRDTLTKVRDRVLAQRSKLLAQVKQEVTSETH
jgi:uncharacterized protein